MSEVTISQVRITNFVLTALETTVTVVRLYDRASLWWDDAWSAFTVLPIDIFMPAVEIHLQDPAQHSQEVKIAAYYMCAQLFYAVAWSARISILFTVIRLSVGTLRKILSYAFIVFLTIWAVLFAQVWWVCEREPGWKDAPLPQCDLGLNVAVAQVITDVLCDAFLIFVPLCLKIRITAIFSTTIVTTCVSMSHAFFVLRAGELKEALAAIVQDAVSLIVANLSVLIAYLFRIGTEEPESAPTFGTRSIITFGGSGKKRNPAITTTYITTETMVHEDPAVITQKTLGSTVYGGEESQLYMKGHVMTRI
ncbi:hypothetical protein M422DRAFT_275417 [Sphaerobolus stellatus SS14]|uniref:Integral membrane protein n=1 Tax=Sphaerobolus stellatus (strain SS14) TaxID=990650 RepID=A0A0C9TPS8_SPHS4|nr:hypothetical protein M422DRAFT_275417 [Sphaerobolus stellatus SS14]